MQALKSTLKGTLASPLGWRLSAPLRRPRVIVLAYHRIGQRGDLLRHVDVGSFREQMRWIREHCVPIAPAELQAAANGTDHRPRVLVTFDDGYRDYFRLAYPILHELRIPAANFLSTDYIDTGRLFWWDIVDFAGHRSRKRSVRLPWPPHTEYALTDRSRPEVLRAFKTIISSAPDVDRDEMLRDACRELEVDPRSIDEPRQVMTWDEVRASREFTYYGGHTHTHVRVSRVDPTRLETEIRTCRDRLAAELGVSPPIFAYPIGDGCAAAQQLLPKYGFTVAFTIHKGYVEHTGHPLHVPRFTGPTTPGDLAWLAMGHAGPRNPVAPPAA